MAPMFRNAACRGMAQELTSDGPYTSLQSVVSAISASSPSLLLDLEHRADMYVRHGTRQSEMLLHHVRMRRALQHEPAVHDPDALPNVAIKECKLDYNVPPPGRRWKQSLLSQLPLCQLPGAAAITSAYVIAALPSPPVVRRSGERQQPCNSVDILCELLAHTRFLRIRGFPGC